MDPDRATRLQGLEYDRPKGCNDKMTSLCTEAQNTQNNVKEYSRQLEHGSTYASTSIDIRILKVVAS